MNQPIYKIKSIIIISCVALMSLPLLAYASEEKSEQPLTDWLTAGPVLQYLPAFADVENIRGETFGLRQFIETDFLNPAALRPVAGERLSTRHGSHLRWQQQAIGSDGSLSGFQAPSHENGLHTWYLATNLVTDRWTESTLTISTPYAVALYVNGKRVAVKHAMQNPDEDPGSLSHDLKLEQGSHRIMLKYVMNSETESSASLQANLEYDSMYDDAFSSGIQPYGPLSLRHLTELPETRSVSISADGNYVAVMMREARPDNNTWESWIELRDFESGNTVQTWRGGMNISGMNWSHKDHIFTYTTRDSGQGTIWKVNLQDGTHRAILRDVEHLGGHEWGPENAFLLFTVSERPDANTSGVSRLDGMHDRYPTWRHRSSIYRLNVESGSSERLTAGLLSSSIHSISPDGSTLIFSRTHVDYSERPFTKVELMSMDLQTLETEQLMMAPWIGGAMYSPDGSRLLITGSPNAFGDAGRQIEGLANDYDTQAYLFDPATGDVSGFTRDFDPSVSSAVWGHDGRHIYLSTTDKSFVNVYRYDTRNERFEKLNTGVDVTGSFSVASNARRAAYIGSGINDPHKAYTFDLRRDRSSLLHFAAADEYARVRFGTSKDWTFNTEDGTEIDGHVYYPPHFNADESYPVIVYYYGGTTPVNRGYSGRYPMELYAAHGYIVYVLQPSGAIGYGQEFSERHVNDWGIRVSGEIIEGVGQFLESHPYADADRVGAIGASFGGFMTKLLITETDMFAAAISHAGISNITSYWGDGFWGYLYSSVASANSYPWDSPEIYVDQSPIFRADQINTPLLLLHGMSDTNVPPAESTQLYTALKLLGRDVDFVQIDQQDHHIVDYNKFILWKNTIVSYFDRHLKDQPQWWEDSYQ